MASYTINGQAFVIDPTTAQWIEPDLIDIAGNGHPIYSAYTNFEFEWSNLSPSGTYQLFQFFRSLNITGSAVVALPRFGYNDYTYYPYSGCVVYIPNMGRYFYEQTLDVRMVVSKVRYDTF